jgi:DNA-binding transcriptional MocR family regulator
VEFPDDVREALDQALQAKAAADLTAAASLLREQEAVQALQAADTAADAAEQAAEQLNARRAVAVAALTNYLRVSTSTKPE